MSRLTIHYPRLVNGVTAAAVTLQGTSRRLTLEVPDVCVSDVDANWTRCYSSTGGDWVRDVAAAEAAVAEELESWVTRHAADLQHEDALVRPTVRPAGEISFLLFRNQPGEEPQYEVGDRAGFAIELREIRRSVDAKGYSLIWRASGCRLAPAPEPELDPEPEPEPEPAPVSREETETELESETEVQERESSECEGENTDADADANPDGDEQGPVEVEPCNPDPVRDLVCQVQKMRDEMDTLAGKLEMLTSSG